MAQSETRQQAADARRIANTAGEGKPVSRETTTKIRQILTDQFERGRKKGRAEVAQELEGTDPRTALLDVGADLLSLLGGRVSAAPNSGRASAAFRESEGILRDARKLVDTEPEKG